MFVGPTVIAYLAIGILASWRWLFYPGLVIWVGGWLFTCWPILILGRFASRSSFSQVQILSDHKVVEKGPYKFIRHPIYTGTLVAFIGLGLALLSWVVLLYVLTVGSIGILVLIHFEESFMVSELGDQYIQYKGRTTKCLIPFIW